MKSWFGIELNNKTTENYPVVFDVEHHCACRTDSNWNAKCLGLIHQLKTYLSFLSSNEWDAHSFATHGESLVYAT